MTAPYASAPALLAVVRRACAPALYAQGTRFAADGNVRIVTTLDDELVVMVEVPGWLKYPTVSLFPEGPEWTCDCGSKYDPCDHVAAAVIALDAARKRGEPLGERSRVAGEPMGYRFARGATLSLARVAVAADGSEKELGDDACMTEGVAVGDADFAVDRALLGQPLHALSIERIGALFAALVNVKDVKLDGVEATVSDEPIAPHAVVEDAPGSGFTLRIERDSRVDEVLGRGIVRAATVLHPAGATELSGESLELVGRVRTFARDDTAELVLDVLPKIAQQVAIALRARRLPARVEGMPPRVQFALAHDGPQLAVVPTVVYGDPVCARVENGRLMHVTGQPRMPARDTDAEVTLSHRLRDELGLVVGRRAAFTGTDAARFAQQLRAWDQRADADGARQAFGSVPTLVPRFDVRDDGFDLFFEAPAGAHADDASPAARRADAAAVLHAFREGLDLVPLEGGGWAPLPAQWLARHGNRVADLLAARRDDGSVSPAVRPELAALCDALEHPRPPALARLAPLLADFTAIPPATLPADLTATLRPYQRRGVDWLCFLRDAQLGAVLADDMGLGKTLQTLCALEAGKRALVVCPTSVVHNWLDEIRRFRPALSTSIYHGAKRKIDAHADVTLTTYALLRLDADALANEHWDTLVLDEAQAIKNPDSQAARAAYALDARFRVVLSGTPVENKLEELWSLFHFADRGLLGGRSDFDERYASAVQRGDGDATVRLRARVRPFLLRRLKRDVAPELPPRTDLVLHCELDETERAVYDAVRVATQRDVLAALSEGGKGTLAALEALLRLRQAACHPALVPGQRVAAGASSSKLDRLLEALGEAAADGHKALVFSQWTSLLDLIEPQLRDAGIAFTRLDGSTRDRAGVVREFQGDAGPPVMLVSLKAGGTGLNLTAADHVFLLDPWWNPAVEDQAADRAHRIGQPRPVLVYRMIARDTVEERILALQARKRALADAMLDGGDPGASLTRDDLLALLE